MTEKKEKKLNHEIIVHTGVYTFLHKTTSKDTFYIGSNKKIKCVSKDAKFFNT